MMIPDEIKRIKAILDSMLGSPKNDLDDSLQLEYPCPCCIDKYGSSEASKYNLSLSLSGMICNCWKCSSEGEDTHGSIAKLIRLYGNHSMLEEFRSLLLSIRESPLYRIDKYGGGLAINTSCAGIGSLRLPKSYRPFIEGGKYNKTAFNYLRERGIGWDIIKQYHIGFTEKDEADRKVSYRVIIPSYDSFGELNYWVGRDYLPKSDKFNRLKYDNPRAEKHEIIFNEEKVQWDADITIVEGPFDHIVVPNSIPLLGKSLGRNSKTFRDLTEKCNACVNLWLDDDAKDTTKQIYSLLNHGNLYGKIRIIETYDGKDPSEIYEKYGYKGIAECLSKSKKLDEWMA